jgi:predicted phosphodiesterase
MEKDHHYWITKYMNPKLLPFLSNIPKSMTTEINGKNIRFVHNHLHGNGKYLPIARNPSSAKLEELYEGEDTEIICSGHHHFLSRR